MIEHATITTRCRDGINPADCEPVARHLHKHLHRAIDCLESLDADYAVVRSVGNLDKYGSPIVTGYVTIEYRHKGVGDDTFPEAA